MDLNGARVLVVGATGVLGGHLTLRLAEAGSRLAVTGRTQLSLDGLTERLGGAAAAVEHRATLDLVDVEAAAATVRQAADRFGGLDGVVVAAGVAAFGPARDEDDSVVEELFAVNTFGPMAVVRTAVPLLAPGGAVAVLTAVLADVPTAGMAAYSASKAATSAYLTALRREVRRDRITVLDARPPHLETGLADRALAGGPPRMPPGSDITEVVALVVRGLAEGRSELVADLKERTLTLR